MEVRRHLPWVRGQAQQQFRQALRDRDVPLLMKASLVLFPVKDQPKDEQEATAMMHVARTMQSWMTDAERSFSHFWCLDNGVPSMLPSDLLPKAERYRPKVESAVGIAVRASSAMVKPALPLIAGAMTKAVVDRAEMIETRPDELRDEIHFARKDEFKRLFGVATAAELKR